MLIERVLYNKWEHRWKQLAVYFVLLFYSADESKFYIMISDHILLKRKFEQMKNYRQLIHEDIRNLGISDNFLGEECLYLALDILKDNPMRLCCISKSMYFDMADAMDTTTICIERNLRTFIANHNIKFALISRIK